MHHFLRLLVYFVDLVVDFDKLCAKNYLEYEQTEFMKESGQMESYRDRVEDLEYGWRLYFREPLQTAEEGVDQSEPRCCDPFSETGQYEIKNAARNQGDRDHVRHGHEMVSGESKRAASPTKPLCPHECAPIGVTVGGTCCYPNHVGNEDVAPEEIGIRCTPTSSLLYDGRRASDIRRERLMQSHAFATLHRHYLEV